MPKSFTFVAMVTSLIVAWVLVSPLVDIEDGKLQPFPTLVTMLLLLVVYIPAFRLLIIQQKRLKYSSWPCGFFWELSPRLDLSSQLLC
jgi:hypothetical protein